MSTAANNAGLIQSGSYNGCTFGVGTKIHVAGVSGWNDLPFVRTADVSHARHEGSYAGTDFYDARVFTVDFEIIGDTQADYQSLLATLEAATVKQPADLPLLMWNSTRQINCRPRKRAVEYDASTQQRVGKVSVEFYAVDPRVYDASQTTSAVGLATSSGGFTFPLTFPLSFGAVSTGGSVTLVNSGNFETRPVVVINGPATNPSLEAVNSDGDATLTFSIVLANTDTLTIDTSNRSVLLNGTASRRSSLQSSSVWWRMPPGNTTLTYRASGGSGGASVSYRAAWG